MNEIILNCDGTLTVVGSLAHKLYYKHETMLRGLYNSGSNIAFVSEVDGTLRACQSSVQGAMEFMKDDRILIIKK